MKHNCSACRQKFCIVFGRSSGQNYASHALFVGVSGLAELASRKYKPAAKCFLQASFDHCDCPEVSDVSHGAMVEQLSLTQKPFQVHLKACF